MFGRCRSDVDMRGRKGGIMGGREGGMMWRWRWLRSNGGEGGLVGKMCDRDDVGNGGLGRRGRYGSE